MTDSEIANNYRQINKVLQALYLKLFYKLICNEVAMPLNGKISFLSLVEHVGKIPARERQYRGYSLPEYDVVVPDIANIIRYDGDISQTEYNYYLANEINFYMRLIGYHLATKGVPLNLINNAKTLNERIDLIDRIDRLHLVEFYVYLPTKGYIDENITVQYDIISLSGEQVTDGTIMVYYSTTNNDIMIKRINVGEPLKFKPFKMGLNQTYIFTFSGTDTYKATRVHKSMSVVDKTSIESVFYLSNAQVDDNAPILFQNHPDPDKNLTNIYNLFIPYTTTESDTTRYLLTDMYLDNNGDDLYLSYENAIIDDFDLLTQGIIDISWNANGDIEFLTAEDGITEEPSP